MPDMLFPDSLPRNAGYTVRPPGMATEDYPLWADFLRRYGAGYPALWYDVPLWGEKPRASELADPYQRMQLALTARRVDAVAQIPKGWILFEIRPAAGPGALGQLILYRSLWRGQYPELPLLDCVLLTDRAGPGLAAALPDLPIQLLELYQL